MLTQTTMTFICPNRKKLQQRVWKEAPKGALSFSYVVKQCWGTNMEYLVTFYSNKEGDFVL